MTCFAIVPSRRYPDAHIDQPEDLLIKTAFCCKMLGSLSGGEHISGNGQEVVQSFQIHDENVEMICHQGSRGSRSCISSWERLYLQFANALSEARRKVTPDEGITGQELPGKSHEHARLCDTKKLT